MSNDELQKAIDDITRDNSAPANDKSSEETEALVDEMVNGATRNGGGNVGNGGNVEVPVSAPEAPAMSQDNNQGRQNTQDTSFYGYQGDSRNTQPQQTTQFPAQGEQWGGQNTQSTQNFSQYNQNSTQNSQGYYPQDNGYNAPAGNAPEPRINRGLDTDNSRDGMAPIAAFTGVKVEVPEIPGSADKDFEKRDYGKEMEVETAVADVEKEAIKELYPLLSMVEISADEKFDICMKAAEDTPDAISGALDAAKRITDDKNKAEALLKIIQYKK